MNIQSEMQPASQSASPGCYEGAGPLKRLVVVADNVLIVEAIRSGLRDNSGFQLLGYLDPRRATAQRIIQADIDVVLVDEGDHAEPAIALIRDLKAETEDISVMVLAVRMEGEWLKRAFEAGADGAMSKTIQPAALGTLMREAVNGHIIHSPARINAIHEAGAEAATELSSLTAREQEILRLVTSGATNGDIARQLWITQQTVKFHVSNIYRKLEVGNRTEACHYAHVNGLVPATPPTAPAERRRAALSAV